MSGFWVAMAVAGTLTFLIRVSFLALPPGVKFPPSASRALKHVPPAVLSAIIFPEVLIRDGAFTPLNPRLAAAAIAGVVAWRSRSALVAIVAGMAVLLVLQAVGL